MHRQYLPEIDEDGGGLDDEGDLGAGTEEAAEVEGEEGAGDTEQVVQEELQGGGVEGGRAEEGV